MMRIISEMSMQRMWMVMGTRMCSLHSWGMIPWVLMTRSLGTKISAMILTYWMLVVYYLQSIFFPHLFLDQSLFTLKILMVTGTWTFCQDQH